MSARTLSKKLEEWFEHTHNNPPAAFNPEYRPGAAGMMDAVAASMEADRYYDTHTRIECAAEFQRRHREMRRAAGDTGYPYQMSTNLLGE